MEIARAFAGYTLGEADLLRRAMGKKDKELMKQLKDDFVERSVARGIPREIAEKVFDLMEKFAEYGFNKSHSAAYALLSYQTAYLKAHYPLYFLASILTYEINKSEEVSKYLALAERMGIPILPPDINASERGFTVENGAIRIGLQAIKNVGEEAVQEIIRKRPYKDFIDFCQKVDTQKVNKKTIEALIKAGAFDSLEKNRAKLLHNLPKILAFTQETKGASLFGQSPLLKLSLSSTLKLEEVPEWSLEEKLNFERAALGFYLSDHPLRKARPLIEVFTPYNLENLKNLESGERVILCALISEIKLKTTRSGNKIALLKLEDEFSIGKGLLFPEVLKEKGSLLKEGVPLWFKGEVDREEETFTFLIEDLRPFEDLSFFKEGTFKLIIPYALAREEELKRIRELLKDFQEEGELLPLSLLLEYPDLTVYFEPNGYKFPLSYPFLNLFINTIKDLRLRCELK